MRRFHIYGNFNDEENSGEQEKGNVEFLVRNKLGIYEPDINKLPLVIGELLNHEKIYDTYRNNIEEIAPKNGAKDVAEFIYYHSSIAEIENLWKEFPFL